MKARIETLQTVTILCLIVLVIWMAGALRQAWANERTLDRLLNHTATETTK